MGGLLPATPQVFSLPKPVFASILQIELIGKLHEQIPGRSGYYVCVERVEVEGLASACPSDFLMPFYPESFFASCAKVVPPEAQPQLGAMDQGYLATHAFDVRRQLDVDS